MTTTASQQMSASAGGDRSLLVRVLTSRGFVAFTILMLVGWVVYTLISVTIGFSSDTVYAISAVLAVLILPFSPVAYVIAGVFRPPAPFRAGMLMGVLATLATIAYFVIDAIYWAYEWGFNQGTWTFYYEGDTTSVLAIVAVLAGTAGVIGLFGGTCTAIAAWITNKVRGPRTPDALVGSPTDPLALPPPAGPPTLQQRIWQLDEARRAGLITEQEYTWRRSEIVSQA